MNCDKCLCNTCRTTLSQSQELECKWCQCEPCFPEKDDPCMDCINYKKES